MNRICLWIELGDLQWFLIWQVKSSHLLFNIFASSKRRLDSIAVIALYITRYFNSRLRTTSGMTSAQCYSSILHDAITASLCQSYTHWRRDRAYSNCLSSTITIPSVVGRTGRILDWEPVQVANCLGASIACLWVGFRAVQRRVV